MLHSTERIQSRLLFIMSFCFTALVIYIVKAGFPSPPLTISHSYLLNVIMINITFLGSGIFCSGSIVYLFYKKKRKLTWLVTAATAIAIILTQVIKNYLIKDGFHIYFEREQYLFNPASDSLYISSHTALIFTLATVFAFNSNNRRISIILFIAALIIAFSRIYLGYHTAYDLMAGACCGIFSASVTFCFYINRLKIQDFILSFKPKYPQFKIPVNPFSVE